MSKSAFFDASYDAYKTGRKTDFSVGKFRKGSPKKKQHRHLSQANRFPLLHKRCGKKAGVEGNLCKKSRFLFLFFQGEMLFTNVISRYRNLSSNVCKMQVGIYSSNMSFE